LASKRKRASLGADGRVVEPRDARGAHRGKLADVRESQKQRAAQ
jgi:hypothetical protein